MKTFFQKFQKNQKHSLFFKIKKIAKVKYANKFALTVSELVNVVKE